MSMELRREAERREQEITDRRRRESMLIGDVRRVASRPEGKRLLGRLLAEADLFNPAWTPGTEGAYQAGRRARALELWRLVHAALPPDEWVAFLDRQRPDADTDARADPDEATGWRPGVDDGFV